MDLNALRSALYGDTPGRAPWQTTPSYWSREDFTPSFGDAAADSALQKIRNYMQADQQQQLAMRMRGEMPTGLDYQAINKGVRNIWDNSGLQDEYRQQMNRFAVQEGQARQGRGESAYGGGFGGVQDYLAQGTINKGMGGFFSDKTIGAARGGIGFGDGNQSGNWLNLLASMGIESSPGLRNLADTLDFTYDTANPLGKMPPLLALGSVEGMGGAGSGAYSRGGAAFYDNNNQFAPGRGRYTRIGPMPAPGFTPPPPPSSGSPFRNNPGGQIWGPGAPGMGRNAQTNGRFYGGPGIEERNRLIPGERGVTGNDGKLPSFEELIRKYGYEYGGDAKNFHRNPGGGSVYTRPEGSSPYTRQFPSDFTAGVALGGVRGLDDQSQMARPIGGNRPDVFEVNEPFMGGRNKNPYIPYPFGFGSGYNAGRAMNGAQWWGF